MAERNTFKYHLTKGHKVVHRGMGIRFVENAKEERTQLNNALESDLEEGESG